MNRERLETAKEFLLEVLQPLWEEHGAEKFDMGHWMISEDSEAIDEVIKRGHIALTSECHTAGCFVGWLPTIFPGEFKIDDTTLIQGIGKTNHGSYTFRAAAEFFETDGPEIDTLILPEAYYPLDPKEIQPKHVAERIDEILQRNKS